MLMKRLMIGLCGGTGSGKTTLARKIYNSLGSENAVLIGMDSYYKANWDIPYEQRIKTNYDHPNAFDTELMVHHLKDLKEGKSILCPVYDFTQHQRRRNEYTRVESKSIIIIEGILLFESLALRSLLDVKIFVDTDADVRILRRITREVHERGRSLESVITQYLTTVKPMHEQFIEPYRRTADIIVPEGGHNTVAFDMIQNAILRKMTE